MKEKRTLERFHIEITAPVRPMTSGQGRPPRSTIISINDGFVFSYFNLDSSILREAWRNSHESQ
jgi:hypothetical protein